MVRHIGIKSQARTEFIDITAEINGLIRDGNVANGVCHLFVLHTTAGITVNEGADAAV
ncbi:MAG TPA: YjbQ family protein, partial [Geobacteraceae bacterium]